MTYHKTIERQLEKYLGAGYQITPELAVFFEAVSKTYEGYDEDKRLIERSLELSSKEMTQLNTSLRESFDKIRISDDRFRAFMEYSPVVAWIKDPKDWTYVYINKAFGEIFKMTLEEMANKTDFELWPEDVAKRLRENDLKVLQSGEVMRTNEVVPLPNGEMRYWLVFKFVIKTPNQSLVAGTGFDISEQKKAEDEFKRMNQLMVGRELKMIELKKQIEELKLKSRGGDSNAT